jgi:hypothetical protein
LTFTFGDPIESGEIALSGPGSEQGRFAYPPSTIDHNELGLGFRGELIKQCHFMFAVYELSHTDYYNLIVLIPRFLLCGTNQYNLSYNGLLWYNASIRVLKGIL